MPQVDGLTYRIIIDPKTGIAQLRAFDRKLKKSTRIVKEHSRETRKSSTGTTKALTGTRNAATGVARAFTLAGGAAGQLAGGLVTLLPILGPAAGLIFLFIGTTRAIRAFNEEIRQSILVNKEFEATMSRVKAITQASRQEMGLLRQEAKDLGASTVFTARQVAKAEFTLGKAGFSVNEIIGALGPTLDLAAAGQLEMAEAARLTTNVLRGMKLEIKDLTRVTDILTFTAITSNQGLEDVGNAMKFAATGAQLLNVPLEEVGASLAILANRGIRGTIAGTSLRRTFAVMVGDLQQGEKGLGAISDQMFRAETGFVGLADAIDLMRDAGVQATDAFDIFGLRAGTTMAILLDIGGDAIRRIVEEMENIDGLTKRIAEENLNNLFGAWIRQTSAMEGLRNEIGDHVNPILREMLEGFLTPVIRGMREWVAENDNLRTGLILLAVSVVSVARELAVWVDALNAVLPIGDVVNLMLARMIIFVNQIEVGFAGLRTVAIEALDVIIGLLQFPSIVDPTGVLDKMLDPLMALRSELERDPKRGKKGGLTELLDDLMERLTLLGAADTESSRERIKKLREDIEALKKSIFELSGGDKPLPTRPPSVLRRLGIEDSKAVSNRVKELNRGLQEAVGVVRDALGKIKGAVGEPIVDPLAVLQVTEMLAKLRKAAKIDLDPDQAVLEVDALFEALRVATERGSIALQMALQEQLDTRLQEGIIGQLGIEDSVEVNRRVEQLNKGLDDLTGVIRDGRGNIKEAIGDPLVDPLAVLAVTDMLAKLRESAKLDLDIDQATRQMTALFVAIKFAAKEGAESTGIALQQALDDLLAERAKFSGPQLSTAESELQEQIDTMFSNVVVEQDFFAGLELGPIGEIGPGVSLAPDATERFLASMGFDVETMRIAADVATERARIFAKDVSERTAAEAQFLMQSFESNFADFGGQMDLLLQPIRTLEGAMMQFFFETAGQGELWANQMASVYESALSASNALDSILGKHNKFSKGIRIALALALLPAGIQNLHEGLIKISKSIYPPNPPQLAAGAAQVATGLNAIAAAKQMGAGGGGGGGRSGGGGGGGGGSRAGSGIGESEEARTLAQANTREFLRAFEASGLGLRDEPGTGDLPLFGDSIVDAFQRPLRVWADELDNSRGELKRLIRESRDAFVDSFRTADDEIRTGDLVQSINQEVLARRMSTESLAAAAFRTDNAFRDIAIEASGAGDPFSGALSAASVQSDRAAGIRIDRIEALDAESFAQVLGDPERARVMADSLAAVLEDR